MKTTKIDYYEIIEATGAYGLGYTYKSVADALNEVNKTFKQALERGYDNSNKTYVIIKCEVSRIKSDADVFLSEKTSRTAVSFVRFEESLKCFVAVNENLEY
jgi:hypothetical protein